MLALVALIVHTATTAAERSAASLWRVPGRSAASLNQDRLTTELPLADDNVLVALMAATLVFGALGFDGLGFDRGHPWSPGRLSRSLNAAAIVAYTGVAFGTNWYLERLWEQSRSVSDHQARLLADASNLRWALLLAAILLVTSLWRRTPRFAADHGSPSRAEVPKARWYEPNRRQTTAWEPDPRRFGVAVSGGGIRSASFALGGLQALRQADLLSRARYVASVSGGSYATSALTALNQPGHDLSAQGTGSSSPAPFSRTSPELQALRRSLRYLISDRRTVFGAVGRISLGLLLNLLILYSVTYVVGRPIGWLVGSPLLHPELRLEHPSVVAVVDDCPGAHVSAAALAPTLGDLVTIAGDDRQAWEVHLRLPPRCALVAPTVEAEADEWTVTFREERPAVVALEDGVLTVERQPIFEVCAWRRGFDVLRPPFPIPTCQQGPTPYDGRVVRPIVGAAERLRDKTDGRLLDIRSPVLAVDKTGLVVEGDNLVDLLLVDDPGEVMAGSIFDLRDDVKIEPWQWTLWGGLLTVALLVLAFRITMRPDWSRFLNMGAGGLAILASICFALLISLPWLIDVLPRGLVSAARTDASVTSASQLSWLPGAQRMPLLVVWPLLSATSLFRFFKSRRASPTPANTSRPRTSVALINKYLSLARQLLISVVVVVVAVLTVGTIISGGALNGPYGQRSTYIHDFTGVALERFMPADWISWFVVAATLIVSTGWSESSAWSPQPIYKRRLAHAFYWRRTAEGPARRRYGRGDHWADLAPRRPTPGQPAPPYDLGYAERVGYLDGSCGDGTELVLCCAANVHGSDRSPTGRSAVSFTASRSWLGGPEIGWVETSRYAAHLSRRRRWDINLPGLTSLSGAAVSASMGSQSLSPFGRVLAVLNLRLGAWVPNPAIVDGFRPHHRWRHNPGWPWYLREVRRRYDADAAYYYVSDGGHWENLGLVEALRRGCMHVVVISAAGDGELSSATLAAAVEIARTDLGVEVELDDVWSTRPTLGGDTPTNLPSGRQYILEPGPRAAVGRTAQKGYAFGVLRFPGVSEEGSILLIEASMVDRLPVDVHAYAEANPEFPNISTGDQLFTDRDFESYRVLGGSLVREALASAPGARFSRDVARCTRIDPDDTDQLVAELWELVSPAAHEPSVSAEQIVGAINRLARSSPGGKARALAAIPHPLLEAERHDPLVKALLDRVRQL